MSKCVCVCVCVCVCDTNLNLGGNEETSDSNRLQMLLLYRVPRVQKPVVQVHSQVVSLSMQLVLFTNLEK